MAELKAANATKYDAGGSGDNVISDGLIKSVEKVWIDEYVCTTNLETNDSICIGIIPAGAKLMDITVFLPATHSLDTLATVYLCTGQTVATATYFGSMKPAGFQTTTFSGGTATTLRLSGVYQDVTLPTSSTGRPIETKVWMAIADSAAEATVTTVGTIRSIIKYTR